MKKLITTTIIMFCLMMTVTGCAKEVTKTATAEGYGGIVEVTVTVKGKNIVSVVATGENETTGIGSPALTKIPETIVEHQTINIDVISGATITSTAVLAAAKEALLSAGLTEEEISKAVVDNSPKELLVLTTDVVIIGGGGAGMSAAVEVLRGDFEVVIIEKTASLGGNTIAAGSAMNAADYEMQKNIEMNDLEMQRIEAILALPAKNDAMKRWQDTLKAELDAYKKANSTYLFDSPSLHKLQTYIDGDYLANTDLIDVYGDNALDSVHFLTELGTIWRNEISAAVGATWKRSHTPTYTYGQAGADFVMPQINYAIENGAEILLEAKAEEIIMENGRAIGVRGTKLNGQPFEVYATKGVIIATGGFGANVEMRMEYNKHWENLDESVTTTNVPSATGDGIIMAQNVGANLIGMEWIQMIPTYYGGVVTPYIDDQIYVNQEGLRFVAEDERRDVLSDAALKQTNSNFYIVNDRDVIDENNIVAVLGSNVTAKIESGSLFKANSIKELAEMIGVPEENLQATIDAFNTSVETGRDPFGRTIYSNKIDEPPYWAGLTSPSVHHTMGGIEINEKAQVIDTDGNIIEGLYAAGEVTGGIHGSNRLGGNAITDVITMGRIAGQNIIDE